MYLTPTPEQWACLTRTERLTFRILSWLNQSPRLKTPLSWFGSTAGRFWVEFCISRTCPDFGFENFRKIDPGKGVLLVANHRSFFDLYAVAARLYSLYGNHHYIYFPVRANFFYDNPLGLLVNIPVGTGAMFPPIVRDRERKGWNRYAADLMVDMLKDPRVMIGFHPEGTRNRGDDPYTLLPGKPGCGELIYHAQPNVVPLFLQGFPRYAWHGIVVNRLPKKKIPLWANMVMGEPMDLSAEYRLPPGPETWQRITDRVMARIWELGQQEKAIRQARGQLGPDPKVYASSGM